MKKTLLFAVFVLLTAGCRKTETDEYLLSLDKQKLTESLNHDQIFFYKFAKIAIRAGAVRDTNSAEFQSFTKRTRNITANFSKLDSDKTSKISVTDAILMYKDYRAVNKLVRETDEDIFPTLVEALSQQYGAQKIKVQLLKGEVKLYNQNVEHAVLSMVVLASKDLGKDFALYECSKTQPENLKDSEEKTLIEFVRGVLFFSHQLPYLSEDGISRNINWLHKNKDVPLPYTKAFFGWRNLDNDQTHSAFLGINHLFRGFDRLMMKREIDEERAMIDFELFLEESKKLGIQNEPVWAIESFLYLKKDDPQKAIPSLVKLKNSRLCSNSDKKAIQETIDYLEDEQPATALKGVYDKIFIAKIITKYTFSILTQLNWKKVLTENKVPYTESLFATLNHYEKISHAVGGYMQPEVLETSKKKVIQGGTQLLDKAKGIFK